MVDEHKIKKAVKVWTTGDIRLYECPISYIADETHEVIGQCYRTEDSKRLLFQGEWADQPAWFVEAMDIYRHESAQRAKRQGSNGGKKP